MDILEILSRNFQNILGTHLVGLYLHGSLCLGGFQRERSDIDLLAVTDITPSLETKIAIIQMLLAYRDQYPAKGIEFSLLHLKDCQHFVYPTPYLLHLSPLHYQNALANPETFARDMHGTDSDLACHLTIVYHQGIVLYGKNISQVFSPVPKAYYLKSIAYDLKDAKDHLTDNPIYYLLNFARTEAYLKDNLILSKEAGALWVIENQGLFQNLMLQALDVLHGQEKRLDPNELQDCLHYYQMLFQNL